MRFGKLLVGDFDGAGSDGHARWRCRCDCGRWCVVTTNGLKRTARSCGCDRYTRKDLATRFWSKVRRGTAGECWLWTGATNRGYGTTVVITRGRKTILRGAHRVAWELTHGEIPKELSVLHRCDVPACCNPGHLWLGTQRDNMRDMIGKGRQAPIEQRHRVGETHGRARLRDVDVLAARRACAGGVPVREVTRKLARKRGVAESTVLSAISGRTWKHLNAMFMYRCGTALTVE